MIEEDKKFEEWFQGEFPEANLKREDWKWVYTDVRKAWDEQGRRGEAANQKMREEMEGLRKHYDAAIRGWRIKVEKELEPHINQLKSRIKGLKEQIFDLFTEQTCYKPKVQELTEKVKRLEREIYEATEFGLRESRVLTDAKEKVKQLESELQDRTADFKTWFDAYGELAKKALELERVNADLRERFFQLENYITFKGLMPQFKSWTTEETTCDKCPSLLSEHDDGECPNNIKGDDHEGSNGN